MDGSNCYYHQVNSEFIETYWNHLGSGVTDRIAVLCFQGIGIESTREAADGVCRQWVL